MLNDDFGLLAHHRRVPAHNAHQRPICLDFLIVRVVFDGFHQFEVTFKAGVIFQHIQNKALIDSLLHAVQMERARNGSAVLIQLAQCISCAEDFQRCRLGRGGEGKEAQVGNCPLRLHFPGQIVLLIPRLVRVNILIHQRELHLRVRLARLRRMRLIDDDGKPLAAHLRLVADIGELLDG